VANSKRVYTDSRGNMFLPMNVEGGAWSDNFMTTPKLIVVVGSLLILIALLVFLNSSGSSPSGYVVLIGVWFFFTQLLVRYIVFEERYYYRMYKQLKEDEISKPSLFFGIADIQGEEEAVLTYLDGKVGVIVKLERDTITGKNKEFQEVHYDALSDMYKEIVDRGYNFVQLNLMEQGVNDPRLEKLGELVDKARNSNIKKITELKVNYIKSITRNTLYDTDYIMIYTKDLNKKERIIEDMIEIAYRGMNGGFIGFKVLGVMELVELLKEDYGVRYFDIGEAMVGLYGASDGINSSVMSVSSIEYSDKEYLEVDILGRNIIKRWTSKAIKEASELDAEAMRRALISKDRKEEFIGVKLGVGSEVQKSDIKETKKIKSMGVTRKEGHENLGKSKVKAWGRKRGSAPMISNDSLKKSNQHQTNLSESFYNDTDEDDETIVF